MCKPVCEVCKRPLCEVCNTPSPLRGMGVVLHTLLCTVPPLHTSGREALSLSETFQSDWLGFAWWEPQEGP